jgi:hypothetical protein
MSRAESPTFGAQFVLRINVWSWAIRRVVGRAKGAGGIRLAGFGVCLIDFRKRAMTRESSNYRVWTKVVGSAALGALAMYVMDPDRGRRRRAIARDKARSLFADAGDMLGTAARDVRYRMQGLRARARRLMQRHEVPEDLVLIERVRTKLGRVCSHPHAIQVGANHGRVTLSGPVLAVEAEHLLDAARATWGVREVEDRLVVYPRPDFVSSLQGGVPRRERRLELFQDHWTPSLRVAAMLGGGLLAFAGARRGDVSGVALMALGAALAARGATNVPFSRLTGMIEGGGIDQQETIQIDPQDKTLGGHALH